MGLKYDFCFCQGLSKIPAVDIPKVDKEEVGADKTGNAVSSSVLTEEAVSKLESAPPSLKRVRNHTNPDGTVSSERPGSSDAQDAPAKKKRRTIKRASSDTGAELGETWLVLPNDVKLGSDVKELTEGKDGKWKNNLGDELAGVNFQILKLEVENSDNTWDVQDEQGVSRRRLFGKVST